MATPLFQKRRRGKVWMCKSHSVSRLCVHLIWCTKYRQKIITDRIAAVFKANTKQVCDTLGLKIEAMETESDHVHLVLWIPPDLSVGKIIQRIKGATSRAIRQMPIYQRLTRYKSSPACWAPSYSASSCQGESVARLKKYVKGQAPRLSEEDVATTNKNFYNEKRSFARSPGMNSRDSGQT